MKTKEQFSDSKKRLLEKFLRGEAVYHSAQAPLEPRQPEDPVPLAPSQQQVWLHAQMAAGSPLYNEPLTLHYRGTLDRTALEAGFRELLRRHEIWRTTFASLDGQTVQAVHPDLTIAIPFTDLTALPQERREQEALRIAGADARRPFDLALGPLVRVRLIKFAEDYHRIYLTAHHIVLDGVGIYDVLMPELSAIYEAFSAGLSSPLPEPRYQYADYAIWEKRLLDNDSAARRMDYWRRILAGELPTLELPTDRPRPAVASYRGSMESFSFTKEMTEALKKTAKSEGVSLYMLLLAAFKTLLYRYTGQEDILIGAPADGRRRSEFTSMLGFFLHTMVLRTRPTGDRTFREYLGEVKDTLLGALAASDIPFDQLVRELHPRRDPSRHPLFQVMFADERRASAPEPHPHWDLTRMDVSTGTSKMDLYVGLEERPEGLVGRFLYNTDIFDASTVSRMAGHWISLLEGILREPGATLSALPLLTRAETRLVSQWNNTSRPAPHTTVSQMFEDRAARNPSAIAVECDGTWLTYRELNQEANRLARRLREVGAGPEILVGLCVERGSDMVVALLAILKAGAAYLPLDPALPEERLRRIVQDAQAPILLCGAALRPAPSNAVVVFTDEASGSSSNLEAFAKPENLAYVLYTSGSTGRPKGVEISHSAVVNFLESMRHEPGITAADTLLAVTTLSFDIAALEIFLPLIAGGRLVIASREDVRDPARLVELIREIAPSVMQATPATWRSAIEAGWTGDRRMRILCGGEAMPRDLAQQLLPRCAELWNMYGPTETTIWSTLQRVESGTGPVPIGRPIANTQVYILDRQRRMVAAGVAGELYIGGAGLARGYLRRDDLTEERFIETDWGRLYRTGDLARWRPDGVLECLGRADNQMKIRGFRVEPEEIEAALLEHPEIRAAAVRAWPDASGHLSLTAYVVSLTRPNLRAFLNEKLPEYMVPPTVFWMEALPLTPNGKLNRSGLPRPNQEDRRALSSAPSNEVERRLAAVWESVLGRKGLGVHDNFFDLGGHSLLVAKLLRRVEAEFGARLSMAAMFQAPTIQQFAELLNCQDGNVRTPKVSPIQSIGSQPPLFWMHAGPRYRALAAHLGHDRPFLGVAMDPEEERALPEHATLQEIGACVVRKIRAIRPHGPYHLGGLCVAGLLAYEVAAQLSAAGEEVGTVVMLDALNLRKFMAGTGKKLLASRARFHWKKLTGGSAADAWQYLVARFNERVANSRALRDSLWSEKLHRAAISYQPQDYSERVLFFEPSDRLDIAGLAESWAGVAQPRREILAVEGDHLSVLQEPMVAKLAQYIRRCLEEADGPLAAAARPASAVRTAAR